MVWSKLKTRLVSAAVLIVLLLVITFAPAWVYSVAVCAVSHVVLRELLVTFGQRKKPSLMITSYIAALVIFILGTTLKDNSAAIFMPMVLLVIALFTVAVFHHQKVAFSDVKTSLFSVLYAVLLLMPLSHMRHMENGLALVFLAFIGAWLPDTAAYFAGSFLGKHKLIEAISPNKTGEGSIGAVVGSLVSFLIYGGILTGMGFSVNFIAISVLALLCGVVAQLGDLSASLMKRSCNAKDFGNLIPGHGGLLDRVDSLMFITPLVYCYISLFPVLS